MNTESEKMEFWKNRKITDEKKKSLKHDLDKYLSAYSHIDTQLYFYSTSLYYELYCNRISSQVFSDRVNRFNLKIFEIVNDPNENNLIRITFFVPYEIKNNDLYLIENKKIEVD